MIVKHSLQTFIMCREKAAKRAKMQDRAEKLPLYKKILPKFACFSLKMRTCVL